MADTEKGDDKPPEFLPGWLSERRFVIAWIVSFSILILVLFFIFVPVAVTVGDADGNCFLYADSYGFGAQSVCSYCIAIAVILLCICILRLVLLIFKVVNFSNKITDGVSSWFSVWGVHIAIFVLDVLMLLLLLVTASLLSAGLSHICENLYGGRSLCSEVGVMLPTGEVNESFYQSLAFAEGSAWVTFILWLLVVVVEVFFLFKNGTFAETASKAQSVWTVTLRGAASSSSSSSAK